MADHDNPAATPTRPVAPTAPIEVPVTDDCSRATAALLSGGLVALPTETVYGLAARAEDPNAVARVYRVKDRPRDHPLILHIADAVELDLWASDIPDHARRLANSLWPGPLTLLVRRSDRVSDIITGGRDTVAVRVPDHPLAQQVIRDAGALVAPSANRFGRLSATCAEHVSRELGAYLDPARDLILDGGSCAVGVESTIVDCTRQPIEILRPGGVSAERIMDLLDQAPATATGPNRASGMLSAHYAPRARVLVAHSAAEARRLEERCRIEGRSVEIIDMADDLERYAHDLYARLHAADHRGVDSIIAVLPAPAGLGSAIRDRIMKAAADQQAGFNSGQTNPNR
jgi:L-threonylcarbamoyladenylate synthase